MCLTFPGQSCRRCPAKRWSSRSFLTIAVAPPTHDPAVPSYLAAIARRFPSAGASLLVRYLRQPEQLGRVALERAVNWLACLSA